MSKATNNIYTLTIALLLMFVMASQATAGGTLYVDDDAPLGGDGTSWDTAYKFLQDAINDAVGGGASDIHIAQGTYKPDRDEANPNGTGDREATFELFNELTLIGGYAGIGAKDPDELNFKLYETILSGDLLGDDEPDFVNNEENSFHVLVSTTKDAYVILSGLTITSGNADDPGTPHGGGLYCNQSDPLLTDCLFTNNSSGNSGGAIYTHVAELTAIGCTFINNSSVLGGAIRTNVGNTEVVDCLFISNHGSIGGAIYGPQVSYVYIEKSSFLENTATSSGGALNLINVAVINSLFVGNNTNGDGGAMRLGASNTGSIVVNCTIANNSAGDEGGGIDFEESNDDILSIANTIIWGNSDSSGSGEEAQIHQALKGILDLNYCCIHGLTGNFGGLGNIGEDPLFVDQFGPDKIPGTADDDLHLAKGSPCANRANPLAGSEVGFFDIDGEPRFQLCRLDIGADESAYFHSDCNDNGKADECDLEDFTSTDCNKNGVLDECDIAQNFSEDCNNNGFPDECDVDPVLYRVDDGTYENVVGLIQGGELIWFNKFTALRDNETIIAIDISWGLIDEGTLTDFAIWIDPNNDGDPTDAQLITLVEDIPATNVSCAQFNTIEIPSTIVGNTGDVFYVGAHLTNLQGDYPACFDQTPPSQLSSWFVSGNNLNQLWNNPIPPTLIDDDCCSGNWLIRARRLGSEDNDENGVPDECKCPWDLDNSGSVGTSDLLELFAQWGTDGSADFDGSGAVGTSDLLILFANWGPCE